MDDWIYNLLMFCYQLQRMGEIFPSFSISISHTDQKEEHKFYQATVITHHSRAGDYQRTQSRGQIWHKGGY